jgi:hypothetical protein
MQVFSIYTMQEQNLHSIIYRQQQNTAQQQYWQQNFQWLSNFHLPLPQGWLTLLILDNLIKEKCTQNIHGHRLVLI